MPTNIDNRVVQMTFNNKSFEKGVETTLKTIDKLNKALEFKDASKGFDNIEDAANSVNLSKLSDNIQSIADRFSGLGIIGAQIWTRIGNAAIDFVTGPFRKVESAISGMVDSISGMVVQGGINRALNLEQAEFMLSNLGHGWDTAKDAAGEYVEYTVNKDGKRVKNAYKAIAESVDGTAFSLDQAAGAAANFLASGVDAGEELYNTLRAVQGLSSVFSTDFEQVSGYFQKVASSGALSQGIVTYMTQTMKAPIGEILKKNLALSDAELEEALKNGMISFATFRDVMLKEFGDSLDKANESWKGVTSNIRSAFGRIGAAVAEPTIKTLIPLLNTIRETVNRVKDTLTESGVYEFINTNISKLTEKLNEFLKPFATGEKKLTALENVASGVIWIFTGIVNIFKAAAEAFSAVFLTGEKSKEFGENFRKLASRFRDFTTIHYDKFVSVFTALFNILKPIIGVLKIVFTIVGKVITVAAKISGLILYINSLIINGVANLIKMVKNTTAYKKVVEGINKVLKYFRDALKNVKDRFKALIDFIKNFIDEHQLVQKAVEALKSAFEFLRDVVKDLKDHFKEFLDETNFIEEVKKKFKEAFEFIKEKILDAIHAFEDFTGIDIKMPTLDDLKEKFNQIKNSISETLDELTGKIIWAFENPEQAVYEAQKKLEEFADTVAEKFSNFRDNLETSMKNLPATFEKIKDNAGKAKGAIQDFFKDDEADDKTTKKVSMLQSLADALTYLKDAIGNLFNAIFGLGKAAIDTILDMYDKIKDNIKDMSFKDFIDMIYYLIKVLALKNWAEVGKSLSSFLQNLANTATVTKGGLTTLADTIPLALLKIGGAFLAFAFTLNVISNIPEKALDNAETALFAVLSFAIAAFAVISKINAKREKEKNDNSKDKNVLEEIGTLIGNKFGKVVNYIALGAMLTGIGLALLEIAGALKIILNATKGASPSEVLTAFLAIVALIGIIALFIKSITPDLEKINAEELSKIVKMGSLVGLAIFIKSLGGAILAISIALAGISGIKFGDLIKGVAIIGLIMAAIAGIIVVVSKSNKLIGSPRQMLTSQGNFLKIAGFIVALTAAAVLISVAVVALGVIASVFDGVIGKGLLTIVSIAVIIVAMAWLTSKVLESSSDPKKISGAIVKIAIALLIASKAMLSLSEAGIGGLLGALGLVAAMGAIIGLVFVLKDRLEEAKTAAILIGVVAAALLASAFAVSELSKVEFSDIGKVALILVILAAFGLVMSLLAKWIGNSTGAQTGLLAIGGAFLGIGAGIFLFAAALSILFPLMDEMQSKSDELKEKISTFTDIIVSIILSFFDSLLAGLKRKASQLTQDLGEVLLALVVGIVQFLNDNAFAIGEAIGLLIAAIAKALVAAIISLFVDLWNTITGKDGFDEHSPSKKLLGIGKMAIQGLLNGFLALIGSVWDFITSIPGKILELLGNLGGMLFDWAVEGIKGIINAFEDLPLIGTVTKAIEGIVGVITAPLNGVISLIKSIAGETKTAFEDTDKEIAAGLQKTREQQEAWIKEYHDAWAKERKDKMAAEVEKSKQGDDTALVSYSGTAGSKGMTQGEYKAQQSSLMQGSQAQQAQQKALEDAKAWTKKIAATSKDGMTYIVESTLEGYEGTFEIGAEESRYFMTALMAADYENTIKFLKIHSPSKRYAWVSEMLLRGYNKGFVDNEDAVYETLATFSENVDAIMASDVQPTITPVLDLTAVQNGANQIGAIIGSKDAQIAADLDIKSEAGKTAERLDSLSDLFNQVVFNTDSTSMEGKLDLTATLLAQLITAVTEQQLVLDTGAVVGGIVGPMDKALGSRFTQVGRRV